MWNKWRVRWEKTIEAIKLLGGASNEIYISKPASEQQVIQIEEKLGYRLPESFRDVLLNFAGECIWDVNNLIDIDESREDWVRACFSNSDDEYDRVWHNKLAFMSV